MKYNLRQTFKQHREAPDHIGTHVVSDMWNCQNLVDSLEEMQTIMLNACHVSNATVLDVSAHKFDPQGLTVLILLAESHISIHTWPEYDYVAVDAFTCGKNMDPMAAVKYLEEVLRPKKTKHKQITRGDDYAKKR